MTTLLIGRRLNEVQCEGSDEVQGSGSGSGLGSSAPHLRVPETGFQHATTLQRAGVRWVSLDRCIKICRSTLHDACKR